MIDRDRLDEIILENGGDDWWKPELFQKNTLQKLPVELEVLSFPPAEEKNFNCFVYALGLSGNAELVKDCSGFIYDTFFKRLVENNEIESTNKPKDGDYIVYQDLKNYPNMITHIGVLNDDKVISKWAWGPLLRHSKLDVPSSYGDTISYFTKITAERATTLYTKYKKFNVKPTI